MRLIPPAPPQPSVESPRAARAGCVSGAHVWLLRHAEVDAASAGLAYGDRDVPLSARGEEQTQRLADRIAQLDVRRLASSPLQRALSLARACGRRLKLEVVVDPRLRELDRGDWQDLPVEEYRARWEAQAEAWWRDPWNWRGHGGESEAMLAERSWPALQEQVELAAGGCVVLATHRNVIRALTASALGLPAGRSHALHLDPAHAVLLHDGCRGWELLRSNIAAPPGEPD